MNIVSSDRLGHAVGHDGYTYFVSYAQHDRDWPGADTDHPNTTFVVSRQGPNGVDKSWGFHDEREAWDFLTGVGPMEYTHWSQSGQPIKEVRERLAIADGMVKRYRTDANTGYLEAEYTVGNRRERIGTGEGKTGQMADFLGANPTVEGGPRTREPNPRSLPIGVVDPKTDRIPGYAYDAETDTFRPIPGERFGNAPIDVQPEVMRNTGLVRRDVRADDPSKFVATFQTKTKTEGSGNDAGADDVRQGTGVHAPGKIAATGEQDAIGGADETSGEKPGTTGPARNPKQSADAGPAGKQPKPD